MKYVVEKREVYTVKVTVDADNPTEAYEKVQNGQGSSEKPEFFQAVDPFGVGYNNVYQWYVTDDKGISKPVSQV